MLDIRYIRENLEKVKAGAHAKRIKVDFESLLQLDQDVRKLKLELESLQAERNQLSKTIGRAPPDERDILKNKVTEIKGQMEHIETALSPLQARFAELLLLVPQPAREDVPIGKDDTENVEVKLWGTPKTFSFATRDHVELGVLHDGLDVKRGVKLAGARSYILKGAFAQIESAILRLTCDKLNAKGYTQMSIPVLVKEDCMTGTGYFPTGRDQAYYIEKDALALVGTAEVSLTSYLSHEMLKEEDLPYRFFAQSQCFRREAGTYGKDTHGLYRVHQFQKVEQVIVAPADPEASEQLHQELLSNAEEVLQDLELPYRVVYVCTGDLGQGQLRKHDIETWMPSRGSYSETHSCSTFHDFQARRLEMRYKNKEGQKAFCYTLNNTAIATPRALIPFLEYHQEEDGSIYIPEKLRPYLNGTERIHAPA